MNEAGLLLLAPGMRPKLWGQTPLLILEVTMHTLSIPNPQELKSWRASRHWSRERLARELQISAKTVERWESNGVLPRFLPTLRTLTKLMNGNGDRPQPAGETP